MVRGSERRNQAVAFYVGSSVNQHAHFHPARVGVVVASPATAAPTHPLDPAEHAVATPSSSSSSSSAWLPSAAVPRAGPSAAPAVHVQQHRDTHALQHRPVALSHPARPAERAGPAQEGHQEAHQDGVFDMSQATHKGECAAWPTCCDVERKLVRLRSVGRRAPDKRELHETHVQHCIALL